MENASRPEHRSAKAGVREKAQLMSASEIDRTLLRLAYEIIEQHDGAEGLVFVGIRRRGVPLAERLAGKIGEIEKVSPLVATLDITFYRDDLSTVDSKPVVHKQAAPFSIEAKDVILVDDVLYTGRTTRAALDALVDMGRPRGIQLIVLVDRGHRELPIKADYVGKNLPTNPEESVQVRLQETDGNDEVVLQQEATV